MLTQVLAGSGFDAILESKKAAIVVGPRAHNPSRRPEPATDNCQADSRTGDCVDGLRLDDLWIHTDLFAASHSPLDRLRQWFEAAGGAWPTQGPG